MKRIRFVSVHEMLSLDPNSRRADSSSATPLLKLVCPNLVRLDHDLQIKPGLAASWSLSKDHRVFRFGLRPRLRFHSGRPVTAERIVWNYERLFDSRVGSLVVTSSLAAMSGQPRGHHYAATKGGVISMVRGLAVELARYKIRANAILPGWTDTEMTEISLHEDKFVEKVLPRVPLRRWGIPADFGGIAVYLASDASAYHTGDAILIDGGYSKF